MSCMPHTLLDPFMCCRKLRNDLATAHKDADHQKLLAHTVSKSFAAAINENEQLREFATVAQQSAHALQAQAQASQQQSRHYQAEIHRLQKKLDRSLRPTTTTDAAISEHISSLPKHLPGLELAASKRKARDVSQTEHSRQQQELGDHPGQHRHAETQTEAIVAATLLGKQQTTPEPKDSASQHPQSDQKAVHSSVSLHPRVALLQRELEAVRSELLAMQQAAQHDQDHHHALLPVQCVLQQTEAAFQSIAKLQQNMKQGMPSSSGLAQRANCVSQQVMSSSNVESEQANSSHKRQQQDEYELSRKRQKVQANAAA